MDEVEELACARDVTVDRLMRLEQALAPFASEHAAHAIARSIRSTVALRELKSPLGWFIYLGTENRALQLARGLAVALQGNCDGVVHLDMERYHDKDLVEPLLRHAASTFLLAGVDRGLGEETAALIGRLRSGDLMDGLGVSVPLGKAVFIMSMDVTPECTDEQARLQAESHLLPELLSWAYAIVRGQ